MIIALQARKLASYIESLDAFPEVLLGYDCDYDHIGALFTNIVLQAGLNYRSVVKPRVDNLLFNYPHATTRSQFEDLINVEGLEKLIRWQHPEKLRRMRDLLSFARFHQIDSCGELKIFLRDLNNQNSMREIKGFGPKTIDYCLKLLNFDIVAVDRHIYSFVEMADIMTKDYQTTKRIVEYAADFLQISRSAIDQGIWLYMSMKVREEAGNQQQLLPLC
jgi:hypothetical protein